MRDNKTRGLFPTDPVELREWIVGMYEENNGQKVRDASGAGLLIDWLTGIMVQTNVRKNYAADQNIPSGADGTNLDALADLMRIQARPQAEAAVCTMRFTISEPQEFDILIPAGTRVTDAARTAYWATEQGVYVEAGETSVDVKAVCQSTGTVGNGFVAGQIREIVDLFPYYHACENITPTDGGAETATDEEFYQIMRLSMDAFSCAGAKGGYVYYAKKASGLIQDVLVQARRSEPGVIRMYLLMQDGTSASQEIKDKVLAECSADTVRPLGDQLIVDDPATAAYEIELTYYADTASGVSREEIDRAVREKVEAYQKWQSERLGRDINPSKLVAMLMEAGIKRVVLEKPEYTVLADGSGEETPQLAALAGDPVIRFGGMENE